LLTRINSIWENSDMAATGVPTPEEAAILQPLVDEGCLPASILTDAVPMAPVSSDGNNLDRKNLRKASALLDEAGWTVGDDGIRRNAKGETLRLEMVHVRTDLLPVMNAYVENLRALGVDASFDIIDDPQLQNAPVRPCSISTRCRHCRQRRAGTGRRAEAGLGFCRQGQLQPQPDGLCQARRWTSCWTWWKRRKIGKS
jgi:ABC-type transport system substrate-binding protein